MIVPSSSPWASPFLIVKKKDGSNRVVIDYRKLNMITKKDSYPLPHIDNTLDQLGNAKFFSAMDLISGYWQVKLPPSEQEKCAITTSNGLYQQTCLPQVYRMRQLLFNLSWMQFILNSNILVFLFVFVTEQCQ